MGRYKKIFKRYFIKKNELFLLLFIGINMQDTYEYETFSKKNSAVSWRYARYYTEYNNIKMEYNQLKKKILNEYITYFINIGYNINDAKILANENIENSHRLNKKLEELIKIKKYKENSEETYNYYYNYCNPENENNVNSVKTC